MPPIQNISNPERHGLVIGASLSVGVLESDVSDFSCNGCNAAAGALDMHIGTMLTPRLSLQGEIHLQDRTLDAVGDVSLTQTMVLLAVQYWLIPRLWIKGGIGSGHLSIDYANGGPASSEDLGTGLALHGAVGYELMHSARFGLDFQLMTGFTNYSERQENVSTTSAGFGVNWY